MTEESKSWSTDPHITRREFNKTAAGIGTALALGNAAAALGQEPETPHVPLGRLVLGGGNSKNHPEKVFDMVESVLPDGQTWSAFLTGRKVICNVCGAARTSESPEAQADHIRGAVEKNKEFYAEKGVRPEDLIFIAGKEDANNGEIAALIRNPNHRIFYDGGHIDQDSLTKVLDGSPVEKALQDRYLGDRNFFGFMTSASSMALGDYMPSVNDDTKANEVHRGMGWFPHAIIDTHVHDYEPPRLARLMQAVQDNPGCIGFGIDSRTALDISGGAATVIGKGNVHIVNGQDIQMCKPGEAIAPIYAQALTQASPPPPEVLAQYGARPPVNTETAVSTAAQGSGSSAAVSVSPAGQAKPPGPMR